MVLAQGMHGRGRPRAGGLAVRGKTMYYGDVTLDVCLIVSDPEYLVRECERASGVETRGCQSNQKSISFPLQPAHCR
jgi:hypothetical protein